jgi:type II secretory pathway pseudopilin PulG
MITTQIKKDHKKAFSMITAIFTIVVMASLTALIMGVTGKTLKATTQQYQKEQAVLLARSYTELAILYVMSYERNSTNRCIQTINSHFGEAYPLGYDITTNIQYIGQQASLIWCPNTIATLNGGSGFDSTMSLVIDTYVNYRDFDDPLDKNITFHRKSLQKL